MNIQNKIIAIVVLVILLVSFPIRSFIIKNSSIKAMKTILRYWQEKDFYNAIEQWEDRQKSPPVDGLNGYTINKKEFFRKNGDLYAKFFINLDFPPGNKFFVPDEEWIFELHYSALGWKVSDFAIANPLPPPVLPPESEKRI
jgi:hypothetical protein